MNEIDLLDTVQPASGYYAVVGIKGKYVHQELVSTREELDALVEKFVSQKFDVYFGVAKYETDANRTKENVKALKAFWLDIDCGPAKAEVNPDTGRPDGYIDQETGLAAMQNFCKLVGLPKPTLVDSGRGLHVYWPLTEEISRAEWEVVADRFREVCRKQDFYVDDKVFEVARILRVPGTYNFKDDTPNEVSIVATGKPVTLEQFRSILGVTKVAQKEFPEWAQSADNQAIQNNIGYSFKRIMQRSVKGDGCKQLLHAYQNQEHLSYYEWFYALSVAAMCEDADEAVHKLSSEYPDYDRDMVDDKVATIRMATSCAKFQSTNPELCEGCPHLGNITGPKQLGKVLKKAPSSSVESKGNVLVLDGDEQRMPEDYKYPYPFQRGAEGPGLWALNKNKSKKDDGAAEEVEPVLVYARDLFVIKIMDDPVEGNVIVIRHHLPHNVTKEFAVPMAKVTSKDDLRRALSARGVVCYGSKFDLLQQYILGRVQLLQDKEREQIMRQQFGWADNNSCFIIGTQEIHADKTLFSPPSKVTRPIAKFMGPAGSFEKWKEVWDLYNQPGLEPVAFAALSAFGSPLLPLLNSTGAVINLFNPRSGTGKTTVLNMINSVYGHPQQLRLKRIDTSNGMQQWIGTLKNIPATIDEFTNINAAELSEFLYSLSNGKGKERMLAGTNELRENNTTWQSISVATANASFAEKLSIEKNSPEGELMRLIEYPIEKVAAADTVHAKHMFDMVLAENYGHAGPIFVRYAVQNMERIRNELLETREKIDRELQLENRERFWSTTGAANLTGGKVAKGLDLMSWDLDRIYTFYCRLVDQLRKDSVAPASDARQVVADYLYRHMQNILVVDSGRDLRSGKAFDVFPKREPKGELLIRIEPDTKRMYIIAPSFKQHCVKYQINYNATLKELKSQGAIVGNGNVRLSKGTNIPGDSIHCLWFDIKDNFVDADNYVEAAEEDAN